MDARINELLSRGRTATLEPQVKALEEMLHSAVYGGSEPGTLGAYNKTEVQGEMDSYLLSIKDGLVQHFEIEPDDALDFVFECADDMAAEGILPPLPDDDAADEDLVAWMNAAKSQGFAQYVQDSAEQEAMSETNGNGEVEEPEE